MGGLWAGRCSPRLALWAGRAGRPPPPQSNAGPHLPGQNRVGPGLQKECGLPAVTCWHSGPVHPMLGSLVDGRGPLQGANR